MVNTTRIIDPNGPPISETGLALLPPHLWFWLLGALLLIGAIGFAARAGIRAAPREGPSRLVSVLADFAMFGGLPYLALASWVYRPEINALVGKIGFFLGAVGLWIMDMTPGQRVGHALLLAVFVYELRIYSKFVGLIWRSINPDLCRRTSEGAQLNMIGRLYGVEKLPDTLRQATPGEIETAENLTILGDVAYVPVQHGYRLHYVPHDAGVFDWMWRKSTLDVDKAPERISKRQVAILATGIDKDPAHARVYRVRHDLQVGHPFGGESANALMASSLDDNKLVSQQGIDGNPYVLAQRAVRHLGTSIPVKSKRAPAVRSTPRGTAPEVDDDGK